VRRAVLNTLCSLVVAASYLWGSCAACREFAAKHEPAHCCQHDKCDRASHDSSKPGRTPAGAVTGCGQIPWSYAGTQDAALKIAQGFAASPPLPADLAMQPAGGPRLQPSPRPITASPPDLPILHTALLI
jgi:hypothetical protein